MSPVAAIFIVTSGFGSGFGSGLDSGSLIGVSCSSFCWSDVPASTTFSLSLPNPFIAKVVPAAKITSSKNHKIF